MHFHTVTIILDFSIFIPLNFHMPGFNISRNYCTSNRVLAHPPAHETADHVHPDQAMAAKYQKEIM